MAQVQIYSILLWLFNLSHMNKPMCSLYVVIGFCLLILFQFSEHHRAVDLSPSLHTLVLPSSFLPSCSERTLLLICVPSVCKFSTIHNYDGEK